MKTKPPLITWALVALGLVGWWRTTQGNVVGYVNVPVNTGYNLIHNPLNVPTGNYITNVISTPLAGTTVLLWDVPTQSFGPTCTYDPDFGGWDVNVSLPPGRGFFLLAPFGFTITFVGEVLQGALTNFVAGDNKLSALGSQVPQAGTLSGELFFPVIDGAAVSLFNSVTQGFPHALLCFTSYGWSDPNGAATTSGPILDVGRAFFVQNPRPDINWVRNFTVQFASTPGSGHTSVLPITQLKVGGGSVTLEVLNPNETSYTVQFSTDRQSWTTLATGAKGKVWQGRYPGGVQGFYQIVQP
jgi:hypothetical protein